LTGALGSVGQIFHDGVIVGEADGDRTVDVLGTPQRRHGDVHTLGVRHVRRRVAAEGVGGAVDEQCEREVGRDHRRSGDFALAGIFSAAA